MSDFPKITKYEYEYYSAPQKWPTTNTNVIQLPKIYQIQIQISFSSTKMTGDEYILFYQKGPNMKTKLSSGEKKYKQKQYPRYILFVVYGMQLQGGFFGLW